MELKGKTAIVTGGSRGIGQAIVTELLKEGADAYNIDLVEGESTSGFKQLAKENSCKFFFKQGDVSSEKISEVINEIVKEAGRVDILVNNAGITRDGLIFRMSHDDWNKVIEVNLGSAFLTSKSIARTMLKQRAGSIINISSIMGIIGNPGQTNYSASKAGLIGFSKSLAREVSSRGVRVNAVAPGFIDTEMSRAVSEKMKDYFLNMIPLGRMGKPEDVAQAVVFLASDKSRYITGHVLQVTGGI